MFIVTRKCQRQASEPAERRAPELRILPCLPFSIHVLSDGHAERLNSNGGREVRACSAAARAALAGSHATGSPGENIKMSRENGPDFSPCREPLRLPAPAKCQKMSPAGTAKRRETFEKMAGFHTSTRRELLAGRQPLAGRIAEVLRLAGRPDATILGKNEPCGQSRSTNLWCRLGRPQVPQQTGSRIGDQSIPLAKPQERVFLLAGVEHNHRFARQIGGFGAPVVRPVKPAPEPNPQTSLRDTTKISNGQSEKPK